MDNFKKIYLIAMDVFHSSTSDRLMYGLLILALLFIATANVPFMNKSFIEFQDPLGSAKQLGFSGINIFLLLISIFVSLGTLQGFLNKDRLILILSKPVRRWQLFSGIISGLFFIVLINLIVMTLGLWLIISMHTRELNLNIFLGMGIMFVVAAIYISFVCFFYTFFPNALSGILAFIMAVAGFSSTNITNLIEGAFSGLFLKGAKLGILILPKINALWAIYLRTTQTLYVETDYSSIYILFRTMALLLCVNLISILRFSLKKE